MWWRRVGLLFLPAGTSLLCWCQRPLGECPHSAEARRHFGASPASTIISLNQQSEAMLSAARVQRLMYEAENQFNQAMRSAVDDGNLAPGPTDEVCQ